MNFFKKIKLMKMKIDKLIKRKKLINIVKFYGQIIDESKLIEKCLKIELLSISVTILFS